MKILPFLLLCFSTFTAFAQVESGEWIYLVDTEAVEVPSAARDFSPQVNPNNQNLVYDFGQVRYQVIFTSDSTLLWKDLMDGAAYHETGVLKNIRMAWLSPTQNMVSWQDQILGTVTLFSDFSLSESRMVLFQQAEVFASMRGTIASRDKTILARNSTSSKLLIPR